MSRKKEFAYEKKNHCDYRRTDRRSRSGSLRGQRFGLQDTGSFSKGSAGLGDNFRYSCCRTEYAFGFQWNGLGQNPEKQLSRDNSFRVRQDKQDKEERCCSKIVCFIRFIHFVRSNGFRKLERKYLFRKFLFLQTGMCFSFLPFRKDLFFWKLHAGTELRHGFRSDFRPFRGFLPEAA